MQQKTKLLHVGRDPRLTHGFVNPAINKGSTVIYQSIAEMIQASTDQSFRQPFYGRRGTTTDTALSEALCQLEQAAGCAFFPSGLAAITQTILSFTQMGDHILVSDSVYEPTRQFCESVLPKFGIEITFYPALINEQITEYIQQNTVLLFTESPSSITMEIPDLSTLVNMAQQYNLLSIIDNTWAAGYLFQPLTIGFDISIQSATKYLIGYADAMLGIVAANDKTWRTLRKSSFYHGMCASPDDIYYALRGLRTLPTRIKQHQEHALIIIQWLKSQPEINTIYYPALPTHPGHKVWQQLYYGANGLLSFTLKDSSYHRVTHFVEQLKLFGLGFSWGGFESLVMPYHHLHRKRKTSFQHQQSIIRLHIGLEDPQDLITDLAQALASALR